MGHTKAMMSAMARDARDFAIVSHGEQMWGEYPYIVHYDRVAGKLAEHGYTTDEWQVPARVHDIVEDTAVGLEEVARRYGQAAADRVDTVSAFGETRQLRHAMLCAKLTRRPKDAPLKCADRIINLRLCAQNKNVRLGTVYLDEAQDLDPLFHGNIAWTMWLDLQDAYAEVEAMIASTRQ